MKETSSKKVLLKMQKFMMEEQPLLLSEMRLFKAMYHRGFTLNNCRL